MSLPCPQCGQLNPLGAIYCESCGTTLSATFASPSSAAAEASPDAVTDLDSPAAADPSPPVYAPPPASYPPPPAIYPPPPQGYAPPPQGYAPPPGYPPPPNAEYGHQRSQYAPGKVRMEWWGDAVNLLCQDPGGWLMTMLPSVLIAFVVIIAAYILAICTFGLGVVVVIGIGGSFSAACGAMLVKLRTGIAPDFNAIMRESSVQFFPGMVLYTIGFIAAIIASCFCFFPCFFVTSVWTLAHCDMGAGEPDPFRAFGRAWNVCMADPLGWLLFGLVNYLACMFVLTMPVAYMAPVLAYRDVYGDA